MKTTKKFLSMLLVVVMVLGLLPASVFATDLEALLDGEVYISISDDAEFVAAPDGTPMGFFAVPMEELLFIDLADYGLEEFIYDADSDDIPEITALHLYIYVHEFILELDWSDVYITGSPGSIYLAGGLFGFSDENLRYDLNGAYPAIDGWGLTADQIVLSDGDFLNVAHYTSWAFWGDSTTGFHYFTDPEGNLNHTYSVTAGEPLSLGLVRSYSDWMNGGAPAFDPEIGFEVYYGRTYGEPEGRVYSDEEGMLEITFPATGTWYVWTNGGYGSENPMDIVSAPAFATVNVPDLIFDLDLTALREPLYDGGILAFAEEDEFLAFVADQDATVQFAFNAEDYEQYILFLDFYSDSDIIGFRINGTNYYIEDTGDGYVDIEIDTEIYTGFAFGYEDDSGREYTEFYLQLGLDHPYHTAGSWEIIPLHLTEEMIDTLIAIDEIYQNGNQITLASGEAIETATTLYNGLSPLDKEVFDYLFGVDVQLLNAAREAYEVLLGEQEIANAVITKIDSIGTVTLDKEETITQARTAYDALSESQKALVTNYSALTAAESTLQTLKKAAADKEAADTVAQKIDSIDVVDAFSGKKITAAREAYESLTQEQKNLVKNVAVLTATEERLAELYRQAANADHKAVYEATDKYISGLGTPSVGSTGGEWMVIDLVRAGNVCPEEYYANVVAFVKENINDKEQLHRSKSTENSRIILALTAAGYDVTNVDGHNLLMGLTDMTYIPKQGINGPIWALIALDSHDYEIPTNPNAAEQATREKLIAYILEKQLSDGGWALSGQSADPDMTGMAVQALAPYYKTNAQVKASVDKALACLIEIQHDNGGYGSIDGVCTESAAQIIVALTALGIDPETDPRFVKNGISVVDALCLFAVEGGGFAHVPGDNINGMATEQGQYALVAYYRFKNGQTALYDMTDVVLPGEAVAEQITAIGTVTLNSKSAIEGVRAAYDALSPYQKTLVTNYETLTAAEAALKDLQSEVDKDTTDKDTTDKTVIGAVENITDVKDNAYTGSLGIADTELADKLLTKDDKQQMQNGVNISIDLQIKDVSKVVSEADKALIEKVLGRNTVGMYLDITLTKQLGEAAPVKITETNGTVTVTIVVPDDLRNKDAKVNRTYKVIRVHEGKTDVLDALYDAKTGKLSFNTDAFSTYALVYTDTAVAVTPDNPKTGDDVPVVLLATMMLSSAVCLAVLNLSKKKYAK